MATYVQRVFRQDNDGRNQQIFSVSLKGEHKDQIHEVWIQDYRSEVLKSVGLLTTDELEQIGLACLRVANFTRGWNDRHYDPFI